jgi:hypothetical protein
MYHLYQYDSVNFHYLRSFLDDVDYYDSGIGAGVRAYVDDIWAGLVHRLSAKEKLLSMAEIRAAQKN